ncbi:MAG TPA: sulfate ABC transporter substrate-binding protein [Fibrobacteria bacterium]|nr:sulfate ABC transporter substrate-binding protein [Fibrobacteria bacterium]
MKSKIFLAAALALALAGGASAKNITLLNVSYDPTRELYKDINAAFIPQWEAKHPGDKLTIQQSHGGSGKQARAVIDGLQADVVTLALAYDVDVLNTVARLIPKDWDKKLPNNSAPYTSTVVFLVRKGNPKKIKDWNDLIRPGVSIVTPNPKTSGGARWNYLAAWGYALRQPGGNEAKAREFVKKLYANVPVLDAGARGATTTFVQRGIGDVALSWENEAYLAINELGKDKFEIVYPSVSILAEPSVAVVEKNAKKKGTLDIATEYLKFLYTEQGQEIAAKDYYRPRSASAFAKHKENFPDNKLFTIDEVFGGWTKAQKVHFDDGGEFDKIYVK